MLLLHFDVSPWLRNDSIVTLAACGRPVESVVWEITPLTSDHYPMINYPAIINKLQLLTLCLLFWVNGADHLTFDEDGVMVFVIMQDHFAAKPTSVMEFVSHTSMYKTINSRQSLSLFQVFLQNIYLPFFFSEITQSPTELPRKSNGLTLVTQ